MKNNGVILQYLVLILAAAVVLSVLGMMMGTLIQSPSSASETSITNNDSMGGPTASGTNTDGQREYENKMGVKPTTLDDVSKSDGSGTSTPQTATMPGRKGKTRHPNAVVNAFD